MSEFGRVLLAGHGERRGRAMHRDAGLDQRVHEPHRRAEVRLIRRHDEAARIAQLLGRERRVERRASAAARRRHRRRVRRRHRPRRRRPPPPARRAAGAAAVGTSPCCDLMRSSLVRRERPVIFTAPLDLVLAHLVDAIEIGLAVARREIENRAVGRDRVVDRLPEVPHLLRRESGNQLLESPIAIRGLNGIGAGVGLPIVSVRMPIWLWK